jgi:toxin ParE1/3/4
MLEVRITPSARSDLIDIWTYIAEDSITHADAFIDRLHDAMQSLSRQPNSGRNRDHLAPGIQSFPFGRYLIFYRVLSTAIEIVRVLHGARDVESVFED